MTQPQELSEASLRSSPASAVLSGPAVELVQRMSDGTCVTPSVDIIRRYGELADLAEQISTTALFLRLKAGALDVEGEIEKARRQIERSPLRVNATEHHWVFASVEASLRKLD